MAQAILHSTVGSFRRTMAPKSFCPKPAFGGLARYLVDYQDCVAELEFGDSGRSEAIPPGWWLLPSPVVSLLLVWTLARLF